MIPKKIHYCWFGKGKIPNELQSYINNWQKICSEYEIILWNEDSFDIECNEFVKMAYEDKKYAFVSDYARAFALYHQGGIYLDTDVELRLPLDKFLGHSCFSGFESVGSPFTALWGSKKGHKLPKMVMRHYDESVYRKEFLVTNTNIISAMLIELYGINPASNVEQKGYYCDSCVTIYPAEYFCIDLPTSYAVHHFYGSWLNGSHDNVKTSINSKYHLNKALENISDDALSKALGKTISAKAVMLTVARMLYYKTVPEKLDSYIRMIRS